MQDEPGATPIRGNFQSKELSKEGHCLALLCIAWHCLALLGQPRQQGIQGNGQSGNQENKRQFGNQGDKNNAENHENEKQLGNQEDNEQVGTQDDNAQFENQEDQKPSGKA